MGGARARHSGACSRQCTHLLLWCTLDGCMRGVVVCLRMHTRVVRRPDVAHVCCRSWLPVVVNACLTPTHGMAWWWMPVACTLSLM